MVQPAHATFYCGSSAQAVHLAVTHFSCLQNAKDENKSTYFIGSDKNENGLIHIKCTWWAVSITEVSAVIRWGMVRKVGEVSSSTCLKWAPILGRALADQAESEGLSSCLQGTCNIPLLLKTWTCSQRDQDSNLISFVWPWANDLPFWSLTFLTCKMGIMRVHSL